MDDDDFEVCNEAHLTDQELYYCATCRFGFCNTCWDQQIPHRPSRRGQSHIKTNFEVARKVKSVLSPSIDEAVQERHYGADVGTAWFGVDRTHSENLIFRDYGKYAELLDQTSSEYISDMENQSLDSFIQETRDRRTPSLISFVGQTGAGKSTIIRLLIELNSSSTWKYGAPVVGSASADVPSSEDVHLYLDPITALSPAPMLYADCEGLDGGEREPLGAKFKRMAAISSNRASALDDEPVRYSSEREISWATSSEMQSREFAVSQLYPRLLYTFSDVVVFVLRNPRVVESIFQKLIEWAAAALEKSSNQPILPHAIIVLNACPYDGDVEKWDVDRATEQLLSSLKDTVFQNPVMRRYVEFWRQRGRRIETLEDLVSAYYFTFQIVRIPTEERPDLIETQIQELYARIMFACGSSRDRKEKKRMLLDAEELQSYLQYAFDHFAKTLDFPFDFVRASLFRNPIPSNFGGNILKMAILLQDIAKPPMQAHAIFHQLSMLVASCIMLDSVRHEIKGTADHLFPEYREHLDSALSDFYEYHLPCDFVSPNGNKCVNVRNGHSKGHQSASGTVLAVGEHSSTFSLENDGDDFRDAVFFNLESLLEKLSERIRNRELQEIAAPEIHRDMVLSRFYSDLAWPWNSQTVCLCCLVKPPEHPLPCGHIFCTGCILDYGVRQSKTVTEMFKCPIHRAASRRGFPLSIYTKPKTAGVRILTLEGGGIRSIVQADILRMLEETFRSRIPLQCFFDLIIADGAGGITGLGLATHEWKAEQCANAIRSVYADGLVRRTGSNIPGVGRIVSSFKSKFETTPFESELKKAFSIHSPLFGSQRSRKYFTKVAVVANSNIAKTVLLSNYNRQRHVNEPYDFFRPEIPASELKSYEAARATTALGGYFKPFRHEISGNTFSNQDNPMDIITVTSQEWRFIWQDLPLEHPDIVLSLGTGCRADDGLPERKRSKATRNKLTKTFRSTQKAQKAISQQELWDSYISQLSDFATHRFWRLDPEFDHDLPGIDDVTKLRAFRQQLQKHAAVQLQIPRLAAQLVASLFYFELSEPISKTETNEFIAKGKRSILCRLPPTSPEIRELASWIKVHIGEEALFLIRQESIQGGSVEHHVDGKSGLNDMLRDRQFILESQTISLASRNEKTGIYLCLSIKDVYNSTGQYIISGMPRALFKDPGALARQSQTSNSHSRESISQSGRSPWIAPDPRMQVNSGALSSEEDLMSPSQNQRQPTSRSQLRATELPVEFPRRPMELDAGLEAQVQPRTRISTPRRVVDMSTPTSRAANSRSVSDGTLRHNVHSVNSEASPDQRNQTITPLGLLAQQVAQSSIKDPTSNPPTSRKSSPAITSNLKSMGPQSTTSATVSRANPATGSAVRGPGSDDKLRSHIRKTKSEQNPDQRRHSPAHVGSRTQQVTQASAAGMSSGPSNTRKNFSSTTSDLGSMSPPSNPSRNKATQPAPYRSKDENPPTYHPPPMNRPRVSAPESASEPPRPMDTRQSQQPPAQPRETNPQRKSSYDDLYGYEERKHAQNSTNSEQASSRNLPPAPLAPSPATALEVEKQKSRIYQSVLQEFIEDRSKIFDTVKVVTNKAFQRTLSSLVRLYPEISTLRFTLFPVVRSPGMQHRAMSITNPTPINMDLYLFWIVMVFLTGRRSYLGRKGINDLLEERLAFENLPLARLAMADFHGSCPTWDRPYDHNPEYDSIKDKMLKDVLDSPGMKRHLGSPKFVMALATQTKGANPFKRLNLTAPSSLPVRNYGEREVITHHDWIGAICRNMPQTDETFVKVALEQALDSFEPKQPGEESCKVLLRLLELRLSFEDYL